MEMKWVDRKSVAFMWHNSQKNWQDKKSATLLYSKQLGNPIFIIALPQKKYQPQNS